MQFLRKSNNGGFDFLDKDDVHSVGRLPTQRSTGGTARTNKTIQFWFDLATYIFSKYFMLCVGVLCMMMMMLQLLHFCYELYAYISDLICTRNKTVVFTKNV